MTTDRQKRQREAAAGSSDMASEKEELMVSLIRRERAEKKINVTAMVMERTKPTKKR
jgi:hypothetical protein